MTRRKPSKLKVDLTCSFKKEREKEKQDELESVELTKKYFSIWDEKEKLLKHVKSDEELEIEIA